MLAHVLRNTPRWFSDAQIFLLSKFKVFKDSIFQFKELWFWKVAVQFKKFEDVVSIIVENDFNPFYWKMPLY